MVRPSSTPLRVPDVVLVHDLERPPGHAAGGVDLDDRLIDAEPGLGAIDRELAGERKDGPQDHRIALRRARGPGPDGQARGQGAGEETPARAHRGGHGSRLDSVRRLRPSTTR